MNVRQAGCRACEGISSGDCGNHGPTFIPTGGPAAFSGWRCPLHPWGGLPCAICGAAIPVKSEAPPLPPPDALKGLSLTRLEEIHTVLKQVDMTMHREENFYRPGAGARPTVDDWKERVRWMYSVLLSIVADAASEAAPLPPPDAPQKKLLLRAERWLQLLHPGWQGETRGLISDLKDALAASGAPPPQEKFKPGLDVLMSVNAALHAVNAPYRIDVQDGQAMAVPVPECISTFFAAGAPPAHQSENTKRREQALLIQGRIWQIDAELEGGAPTREELKRELQALDDAMNAAEGAPPAPRWQPIATAPRDGTRIIVAWANGAVESAQFWTRDGKWNGHSRTNPTHWMPLPAPPVAVSAPPDPKETP